jgi:hypothetical protein
MSNIKNFETPADYQSFKGSDEMVKPNVSYVKETNEIHYNPRFAIDFEAGNYYVDEANYLSYAYNDIKNTCFENYEYWSNYPDFYITPNGCEAQVKKGSSYEYITVDISNKPYYRYLYILAMNNFNYSENYIYLALYEHNVRLYMKNGDYAELYFSDGSYDYRAE